ncbi:hypothetical protein [Aquisphaera insulae]|uniref:hypothetical protein n=1 Tax=Aquisphaera insulae TaxID=2712864 RepID=UPI0013EC1D9E|nr:hypothetical protein [Aquisphaera insulae]
MNRPTRAACLASLCLALFEGSQVVGGAQDEGAKPRLTKITAKENGATVSVRGDRFIVRLPRQGGTRYEWKPVVKDAGAAGAPKELVELREYVRPGEGLPGGAELQQSTFEMPASKEPVRLELIYTYRRDPSECPRDGALYKPESENVQPEPNMRFVVTVKREP